MKKNIYLNIGNHNKIEGIEDYVTIIKYLFSSRGCEVVVTNEIRKNEFNIFIDEFSNYYCNSNIKEVKTIFPETKIIFILTEFIEKNYLITSFNNFRSIINSALISWLNIYLKYKRNDFYKLDCKDFIKSIIFSPIIFIYLVKILFLLIIETISFKKNINNKKIISKYSDKFHKLSYMHIRYLGFEKMCNIADGFLLSHANIHDGLKFINKLKNIPVFGTIYPEWQLEKQKLGEIERILSVEITGTITNYRRKIINNLNNDIKLLGLKKYFNDLIIKNWDNKTDNKFAAYSLHPPQEKNWTYSSPTRIYRAIKIDKTVPILTKKYKQHPLEDLCLLHESDEIYIQMIDIYNNNNKNPILYLEEKIKDYLNIAKENNNLIYKNIFKDI